MKYEIYQISIPELALLFGDHAAAAKAFPEYGAYLDVSSFGSKRFKPEFLKYYDQVAEVECEDLEDVFEIGNGYGDQTKITRLKHMHSVSVGDIVRLDTGRYMMVDKIGFTEVSLRG